MALGCGLIVTVSAVLNVIWGWQLRYAIGGEELTIARRVALVSGVAMVTDLASGYYGCGSMAALLSGVYLIWRSK